MPPLDFDESAQRWRVVANCEVVGKALPCTGIEAMAGHSEGAECRLLYYRNLSLGRYFNWIPYRR